jgi:hypothetical protein
MPMKLLIIDEGSDESYIIGRAPVSILHLEISANLCPENVSTMLVDFVPMLLIP